MNTFFRHKLITAVLAVVMVLSLSAFSCPSGSAGLITGLDVASVAATAAVPVINAFASQLNPNDAALLTNYARAISQACVDSVKELGSSDTKAIQYSTIASNFAKVAAVSLPTGTVSEVVTVISAIGAAVNIILATVNAGQAKTLRLSRAAAPNPEVQSLLKKYQSQVKALGSDKARVQDILQHAH